MRYMIYIYTIIYWSIDNIIKYIMETKCNGFYQEEMSVYSTPCHTISAFGLISKYLYFTI